MITDLEKLRAKMKAENAAFAAAIAFLPNPHRPMSDRERAATEAFRQGNDMEVVRLMASTDSPAATENSLSPEDRAFLVVARWFDKHDAGHGKWWNRIKLWNKRDDLTAAIAEEIRKGAS
jgi:hypothetical protein